MVSRSAVGGTLEVRRAGGAARSEPLNATRAATRARLIQQMRERGLIGPDDDAGLPLVDSL